MLEKVDKELTKWINEIVPDVPVSMLPPKKTTKGITLYLYSLMPAPATRGTSRPPLQYMACYLITVPIEPVEENHKTLGALIFAAMANQQVQVDLQPIPAEVWTSFGLAPQPAFILEKLVRLTQPDLELPVVRQAVVKTTTFITLKGVVQHSNGTPIAGAQVQIPENAVSTQTDKRGYFHFDAVPRDPFPSRIRIIVKTRVQEYSIKSDQVSDEPLVFRFTQFDQ